LYTDPLPVQVEEGLAVAIEFEDSAAPPSRDAAANKGEERAVVETAAPPMRSRPQGGFGPGDDDGVMVPVDHGAPPPPPARDLEAVAPDVPETPAAVKVPSTGGAENAPTFGSWTLPGVGVIHLDATELPSNDREIFEAVVECVFADLSVLEAEVPRAAASAAAASADAGASSSVALMSDAAVSEQLTLSQGGDVRGPVPSIASKAAEGALREPAASAKSAVIAPPLLTAGAIVDRPPPSIARVVKSIAKAVELPSVQPVVAVEEAAPAASQPMVVSHERDISEGASRAASPEIQEAG
jgi:hypothetical protein